MYSRLLKKEGYELVQSPPREEKIEAKESKASLALPSGGRKVLIRSRGRRRQRGPSKRKRVQIPMLPPSLDVAPIVTGKLRFASSSSGTLLGITPNSILLALGTIGIGGNVVAAWATSVKIHSITAWPNAAGSVNIEWASSVGGIDKDTVKINNLPTGITSTTSLFTRPPRDTLDGMWLSSSGTSVFFVTCSSGCVFDLHYSAVLSASIGALTVTCTSASAGQVYYLALDGRGSNKLPPVGLQTTA